MSELINTKGLDCVKPVVPAKSTLELCDEITILVDQPTALRNLKALGRGIFRMFGRDCGVGWGHLHGRIQQKK